MGRNREKIPLFWWSEIKFLFKNKENYGDLLSAYIIEKISGKEVEWVNPRNKWYQKTRLNYLGAGSILHHANKKSVVWGSGIIDFDHSVAPADFRAVRGPRTRKFLLQSGYKCPEIYGDPALLLPTFFHPDIEKEFELAIIPHYNDYIEVCNRYLNDDNILVIDLMTLDIEEVTRNILKCKRSISSSLHGLIVSHAFEIPSVWVKYSDRIFGNDIKYIDYLESVDLKVYSPVKLNERNTVDELIEIVSAYPNLPDKIKTEELQNGLLKASPF